MRLLDILIAIALMAIMALMTVQGLHYFYAKNAHDVSLQKLITVLQTAHVLAVSEHANIGVMMQNNNITTFLDDNGNGSLTEPSQIINKTQFLDNGTLSFSHFPFYRSYFLFTPNGTDNGSIWYCVDSKPVWEVMLSKEGSAKANTNKVKESCTTTM